ncbi:MULTISPECIES: MFS transporter [unclassified Bacillus (in: firmicutes)]|uniref:MFS transporter n=1 Tax=unclassified Bacillus (in: firmicutes) TaxID=185979 RepID=UPI0008E6F0ED|nr:MULTISPECIES: MFS transporter [unclassified Bacillus (in: firmicutes)]PGZ89873.1 MFS transporter [Bacillus sp. AFS029533]SFC40435.1 Fucose permease [Bacillus sp. UNCCL81]
METLLNSRQIQLWRVAIYFIFALTGFAFASWVSRTPAIRDALGSTTAEMGVIIFGLSVGSIIGLISASILIAQKGGRFVMVFGLLVVSIGLLIVGISGSWLTNSLIVFIGLVVFGFGQGICDVAMNVEGTAVEKAAQKSLLTGFHAAFSLGTLLGALFGSTMTKSGISVPIHLSLTALVIVLTVLYLYRFIPADTGREAASDSFKVNRTKEYMAVWKERRTIMIGIIVLGMAFVEGSANDWLPLIMVDGYKVTPAMGSVAYGIFVGSMTIGRAIGDKILDRFGRVIVLRASALLAFVGLIIVILSHSFVVATIGIVFWGLGAAFGFPVGLSAAGDDPHRVAARVSAVSTAGYLAFLVGPPFLGIIGEQVGLLRALIFVLIAVTISGLLSKAAKPIGKQNDLEMDSKVSNSLKL